jgi:DNA-binding FadR family transcriptional regulator
VYVKAAPQIAEDAVERDVSALELAEARRLFEGEACALAAAIITEEQVARLESLIAEMTRETVAEVFEKHELEFHLTIARATGNAAITATVEDLWTLRRQSSGCAAAMRRARTNSRGDFVVEHQRIAGALRARDPKAARQAMHGHLAQVIDDLLGVAESDALEQTREKMAEQRRMLGLRTEI